MAGLQEATFQSVTHIGDWRMVAQPYHPHQDSAQLYQTQLSISLFPPILFSPYLCTAFFSVSQSRVLHPCTEFSAESTMERVQCGSKGGLLWKELTPQKEDRHHLPLDSRGTELLSRFIWRTEITSFICNYYELVPLGLHIKVGPFNLQHETVRVVMHVIKMEENDMEDLSAKPTTLLLTLLYDLWAGKHWHRNTLKYNYLQAIFCSSVSMDRPELALE